MKNNFLDSDTYVCAPLDDLFEALDKFDLLVANAPHHDQHSFREVLYHSDLRFLILPPEYNLRPGYPAYIGKNTKIRIIHSREKDFSPMIALLNDGHDAKLTIYQAKDLHRYVKILTPGRASSMMMILIKTLGKILSRKSDFDTK